jgi:hypothetical protein
MSQFIHKHAFAPMGAIVLCSKCGRSPTEVNQGPLAERLCLAPDDAPAAPAPAPAPAPAQDPPPAANGGGAQPLPAAVDPVPAVEVAAPLPPTLSYDDVAGASPAVVRNGVAVLVQLQDFSIKAKIANFVPTRWRVAPNLPQGIEINAATGALEGKVVDSGGVAFHRQPETSSFAITATSADGRSVTTRLVIHFVDRALRSGMGECVACSEPILERIDARAAACATVTEEAPHGVHAYCHDCFNGMVRALGADGIPLECTACRDPADPQKAAVFFVDDEIMLALNDEARVRYVTLYKAKQPPGTVRIECGIERCPWTADVSEHRLEDVVCCGRAACAKITCRKCQQDVVLEGQDVRGAALAGAAMSASEARRINERNDLISQTHLISCALELRIDEICDRGQAVPCPACGIRSQKNEACTHMVCSNRKCGTRYCYCCGLARGDCNGAVPNGWGTHNQDWRTNPLRCPLYLEMLEGEADRHGSAWPGTAEAALAMFHKERTHRELQKLIRYADREQTEPLLLAAMGNLTMASVLGFTERAWFARRKQPPL